MHEWYVNQTYLDRAIQERAEAQARVAYLLVVGIAAVARFAGRLLRVGSRRLARRYRLWQRRRLTIRELSRLDDRLLRDIGIVAPGSVEAIATSLVEGEAAPAPRRAPVVALHEPRLVLDCPDLKHAA